MKISFNQPLSKKYLKDVKVLVTVPAVTVIVVVRLKKNCLASRLFDDWLSSTELSN